MELSKKKAKGKLPNPKWLRNNQYSGLDRCIKLHPELFAHIKQERMFKTVAEWVTIAERLAKDNSGKLPNYMWLFENDYNGLSQCMKSHPGYFEHIEQDNLRTTIEEWVIIAEQLAKNNDGILPNIRWMRNNGYIGLAGCLRKYPEYFEHIKIKKTRKTTEEWVKIAEKIAKENNGILPIVAVIREINETRGLYDCMKFHPEYFEHIKQEKSRKTTEEYVGIAKTLIKENNGILPKCRWLSKNKYQGLSNSIKKHPHLFKGMKQEYRNGVRTIGE